MPATDASHRNHGNDSATSAAPSTGPDTAGGAPAADGSDGSPAARRYDRDAAEAAARLWWLPLVAGILWTLYGMLVLSLRPETVASLAILAGIAFILGGISQFLLAARARDNWRWLFVVGGVLGIAAGIVAFAWPGITLFALAVFVAWYLVISGIFTVVAALAGPKRDWWWVGVVVGLLQFLLGIWAVGSPGRELLLLVNLVGVSMIFYGVQEIFAAFALRSGRLPLVAEEPLDAGGRSLRPA